MIFCENVSRNSSLFTRYSEDASIIEFLENKVSNIFISSSFNKRLHFSLNITLQVCTKIMSIV